MDINCAWIVKDIRFTATAITIPITLLDAGILDAGFSGILQVSFLGFFFPRFHISDLVENIRSLPFIFLTCCLTLFSHSPAFIILPFTSIYYFPIHHYFFLTIILLLTICRFLLPADVLIDLVW